MHFLIALFVGAASAFAFQPVGWWPLMILAIAALCELIARATSLKQALLIGWGFGVGQFVIGLNWIATAFTFQAAMPAWLGWIAVVLLSLYLAVYPVLAAGLAWRFGRANRLALVLALAGAWALTEWLRATMFTGFSWNPIGVTLVDTPWLAASQWVGTYALSAMVALAGGAIWLAFPPGTARCGGDRCCVGRSGLGPLCAAASQRRTAAHPDRPAQYRPAGEVDSRLRGNCRGQAQSTVERPRSPAGADFLARSGGHPALVGHPAGSRILRHRGTVRSNPGSRRPRPAAHRRAGAAVERSAPGGRRSQQHLRARTRRQVRRALRQGASGSLWRISADAAVIVGDRPIAPCSRRHRLPARSRPAEPGFARRLGNGGLPALL